MSGSSWWRLGGKTIEYAMKPLTQLELMAARKNPAERKGGQGGTAAGQMSTMIYFAHQAKTPNTLENLQGTYSQEARFRNMLKHHEKINTRVEGI